MQAVEPAVGRDRAVSVSRACRVNFNMLALVSLLTGAFLVFSTQSLSVLRRTGLALLPRVRPDARAQLRNGAGRRGPLSARSARCSA